MARGLTMKLPSALAEAVHALRALEERARVELEERAAAAAAHSQKMGFSAAGTERCVAKHLEMLRAKQAPELERAREHVERLRRLQATKPPSRRMRRPLDARDVAQAVDELHAAQELVRPGERITAAARARLLRAARRARHLRRLWAVRETYRARMRTTWRAVHRWLLSRSTRSRSRRSARRRVARVGADPPDSDPEPPGPRPSSRAPSIDGGRRG